MNQKLTHAIQLRSEGKLKESNELILSLVNEFPIDPAIHYQCAWSFDVLGEESKAAPYYEKAIELGLDGEELEGAYIGLGSTYRALGHYERSKKVFLNGLNKFPNNQAILCFYAMTLYNLEEHEQAMGFLLKSLATTSADHDITDYKRAILFYADKLNDTWN
ncbi:tetratricopeptide repeat protein [Cytobacillus purgationiresistens]|uniref:Tetratricopeptide (TPR) repeat protein n=1 Tax=Cytobacillus purgationiresistens TaxID=863449 RepID=A0ABU0AK41_9BACI|nr:tetratricopeptide repeat protein [Cytobacillus purgationiresistens]MDQ0271622.1 tetratricopeptide (TPR) repeat protein [Cytobacillus purgationiresistens]